jgi:protein-S-isoprenylcysteine O-methyltransferase Ste14
LWDEVVGTYRRIEHAAAWSLVAAQVLLLAGIVWWPGGRFWFTSGWLVALAVAMLAVAGVLALAGAVRLGGGLTASPLPSTRARLRTTGAYACIRHPIYTGLLLGGAGVVLLGGRPVRIWAWVGLLGVLLVKTRLEEARLTARFPNYRAYAARTPRLIPDPRRCLHALRADSAANQPEAEVGSGADSDAVMEPVGVVALGRRLDRAEQALRLTVGDQSMCAVARSGQSFPAAKYHEGAVGALREVARDVGRREREHAAANVAEVARTAAAAWRGRSGGVAATNPDWRAYFAGGTQALEDLADELADEPDAG